MGKHSARHRGSQEVQIENSRPYVQGDPLHINMIQTLKNALLHGGGVPVKILPGDFAVYDSEHTTRAATVLLLDMSWSMSWEGRFAAAKKVALAMESLVRSLHPRDYFGIVGFFTRAVELKAKDLPQADFKLIERLVRAAFGQRRKTLSNALRDVATTDDLIAAGIDPRLRAEQLPPAAFVTLAQLLS